MKLVPGAQEPNTSLQEPDGPMDGRVVGQWQSKYPYRAWFQIYTEFGYLIIILVCCAWALLTISVHLTLIPEGSSNVLLGFEVGGRGGKKLLMLIATTLAGVCGGVSTALKWLYHSVGTSTWHQDRIMWRLTVPVVSGVLAAFATFIVSGEVIPIFDKKAFGNIYFSLGFGFFIGLFSDNVLAALERTARRTFGTLREGESGDKERAVNK